MAEGPKIRCRSATIVDGRIRVSAYPELRLSKYRGKVKENVAIPPLSSETVRAIIHGILLEMP